MPPKILTNAQLWTWLAMMEKLPAFIAACIPVVVIFALLAFGHVFGGK